MRSLITYSISFICIILFSCSENPIKPEPPVSEDTISRYTYKYIPFGGDILNVYGVDSNNIWFDNDDGLCRTYNGSSFGLMNFNDNQFDYYKMFIYDINNIYFGGGKLSQQTSTPHIKKLQNGVLTGYDVAIGNGYVYDILSINENENWLSFSFNKVCKFNTSGLIEEYQLASNLQSGLFHINSNNELFHFSIDYASNPQLLYSYKFINNNFQIVDISPINYIDGLTRYIYRCGSDIINLSGNKIFFFNGSSWQFHSEYFGNDLFKRIGGINKDSLLAIRELNNRAFTFGSSENWRIENASRIIPPHGANPPSIIYFYKNVAYFAITQSMAGDSYLVLAIPNKK